MTGSAFDAWDNVFGVIFGLGTLALGSNTSLSKINGLQRHAVTATFRLLYVFVVIEHRSPRLIHCNVKRHPSAAWTLQQPREVVGYEVRHQFLIHDRDSIFANHLDESIRALGIRVLKSPAPHAPKMNAICERVIGTIRRECLDWLIPLSEAHLRSILKSWIAHYNGARPHMALAPGVPDPPATMKAIPKTSSRHRRGESYAVRCRISPWGAASRIFAGGCRRVIELLRTTTGEVRYPC
jgi:hypothetical protein